MNYLPITFSCGGHFSFLEGHGLATWTTTEGLPSGQLATKCKSCTHTRVIHEECPRKLEAGKFRTFRNFKFVFVKKFGKKKWYQMNQHQVLRNEFSIRNRKHEGFLDSETREWQPFSTPNRFQVPKQYITGITPPDQATKSLENIENTDFLSAIPYAKYVEIYIKF